MCCLGASEMEKALMKKLFTNYNVKVRPARTPEERVVVRVGMTLSSFVGLVRHYVLMLHIFFIFLVLKSDFHIEMSL